MSGLKWINLVVVLLFLVVMIPPMANAGSTGKIAGVITDKATGEGLAGPNIEVLGTSLGATTDINGLYVVLNVPPGTYTMRFSMVGYTSVEVTEVKVNSDRIAKIDVVMEETILEGETVTVIAEREAVEFDRTNTAAYVSQEEIEAMPVKSLTDVIQLQAGVVTDAGGGLHFRGGRQREVAYLIDGIPVTNTFSQSGGSNVRIENNFVKELQVITGTFNAEYGSAQSGVINVVTKVPEDNFNVTVDYLTGGYYTTKEMYIGLDKFDPLAEQELKMSLSGPLPFPKSLGKLGFFVNGRFVDSKGHLQGERRFMPEDGWEITVYREWYQATYDPEDPLTIPIPDTMHTGDGETVPINWSKSYNVNAKLVYQPSSVITAAYNMFYSNTEGQQYSWTWRFCPDALGMGYGENLTHMVTFTHTLGENIFYNLRYSYQKNDSKSYMYEDPNDPRYQLYAVNAWDPGAITGFDYGGLYTWGRNWFDQKIHLGNGDITWQINKVIELKGGFEARASNFYYKKAPMREALGYETIQYPFTRNEIRGLEIPWDYFRNATKNFEYGTIKVRETNPDSTQDDQLYSEYNRYPLDGAGYIQTRLSLGDIILNAGLRLDYFWPNDRYAPDYSEVYPEFVGADYYYKQAQEKYQLSPRFGLSFPVSTKGAIRLSYGHFFQLPSYEKMYQNPVLPQYNQFSILGTFIGNPNLDAEKTIQYEVGLQQELTPGLAMELSVYYKDIRDLLGVEYLTLKNGATFYRYINKEYGNASGVMLRFDYQDPGGMFLGSIDYTYMTAKGTNSSPDAVQAVAVTSGKSRGAYTVAVRRINYLEWDQTHSLNATLAVRPTPSWYISLIGQLGSGLPYTPETLIDLEIPGGWWDLGDRKPFRWSVDLRVSKSFPVFGKELSLYLDVYNLFDHLNENTVNDITGRAGPDAYLPEISRLRYQRLETVGEFTRTEADYNPTWYSRPRLIQFGVYFAI